MNVEPTIIDAPRATWAKRDIGNTIASMAALQIPIALIDDHTLFRNVMADMINNMPGYQVVVQCGNGAEYIQATERVPVSVAIVDLHMPIMDGYETIAWIREHQPGTRPLALTFERSEEAMVRTLRAGACGFLPKDVDKSVFRNALDQVATLGHYYDEQLAQELSEQKDRAGYFASQRALAIGKLTEREVAFLRLVGHDEEYTYDQIAEIMDVTTNTVHGYRESIFQKTGIKSKTGLVIFTYKWGLIKSTTD